MKLAVIGTGRIVHEALDAIGKVPDITVTSILARPQSLEKARRLAREYGIFEVCTDYSLLLESTEASTVYIGIVNSVHYSYAKEALLRGKNVILEKPLTGYYDEALSLASLAREKGLFLLEAITVLHSRVFRKMKASIGRIGRIRAMQLNFSQYSSRYDSYLDKVVDPCFDRAEYGGALYDINVYNIHYAVGLFKMPRAVHYYPNLGFNGVDTSGVLILDYDGFKASLVAAKDSDSPCFVSIQGEKGYMRVDGKPNNPTSLSIVQVDESVNEKVKDASGAMVRASVREEYTDDMESHRMRGEFVDFSSIIDTGDRAEADRLLDESLAVMKVLEMARESAGIVFPS